MIESFSIAIREYYKLLQDELCLKRLKKEEENLLEKNKYRKEVIKYLRESLKLDERRNQVEQRVHFQAARHYTLEVVLDRLFLYTRHTVELANCNRILRCYKKYKEIRW